MTETSLRDGLFPVGPGKLACIVTNLEMRARPDGETMPPTPDGLTFDRAGPDLDRYRRLFRAVGRDWLWSSRLALSDDELRAIIGHPDVEVHILSGEKGDCGLAELDFRAPQTCELTFFGLAPGFTSRGLGPWMIAAATERAWARPIGRFWLHTCTQDHPAALRFYQRSGFTAFRTEVEVADDPRRLGLVPLEAAPHIPLL